MANAVSGNIRLLLRAEGAMLFIVMLIFYQQLHASWSQFAYWFLAPDLAFLAYFINSKMGAIAYNTTHTTLLPLSLLAYAYISGFNTAVEFGIIWLSHIGFDRMLGYGLKYASAFGDTHLGKIGKPSPYQSGGRV